jgi:hypothetical protein
MGFLDRLSMVSLRIGESEETLLEKGTVMISLASIEKDIEKDRRHTLFRSRKQKPC